MGSFFVSNFEMKTLSAICFLGYVAAQGAMAPPWVPPTVGLWRMMFTTIIDPTHRTDIGGSDQTSEDIDTVMDAKGWPKCTDDDRWAEEFPWNKDKNMNKCRWAKEWDEYRHYLFTKAALDVCDGTVTQWHPDFAAPPQFAAQGFACSYCYKTQNDACTIDGGYAEAQFAGPAAAPDTDLWFQNAPRNLAECTGTPPVCPGNPPPPRVRLEECQIQVESVRRGIARIIPAPLLSMLTGPKLEEMVCGSPEVSVAALKQIARYRDMDETDQVIRWLWEVLDEAAASQRVLFLKFVSGRSRLPVNPNDLAQKFQIMKVDKDPNSLPTAQTCFFQLRLPPYVEKRVLRDRLLYAIQHCRAIDMDNYMLTRGAEDETGMENIF